MSNNPLRKSSRIANKQAANPYQLAARSVLKKPTEPAKRTWNQQALSSGSGSTTTTTPSSTFTAQKPITPSAVNNLIMQQYGIVNTTPVEPAAPPSSDASSSSPPADTTNNASVQQNNKGKNVEQVPLTFHVPLVTRFAAAAPFRCLQGKSARDKIKTTEKIMTPIKGFLGANHRLVQNDKFVVAYFDTDEDLQDALKLQCTYKEYLPKDAQIPPADQGSDDSNSSSTSSPQTDNDQQKFIEHSFNFINYNVLKAPKSDDQKRDEKARTVQVLDIPLKIATSTIRTYFNNYGPIERISMCTKKLFQQAFITFEDSTSIAKFYDEFWTVLMMRHSLRVLPLNLNDDQRALRRQFSLKLSGLPQGTLPRDLTEIVRTVGAKTCVINRNPHNYTPLNYAYLNFTSVDAIAHAISLNVVIKDKPLFWCMPQTRTCNFCGDPEHVHKDCPDSRNRNSPTNQRYNKLYDRFRPAQHRKPRKSYASATRPNNNSNNLDPGLVTSLTQKFELLMNRMDEITTRVTDIRKEIDSDKSSKNKNVTNIHKANTVTVNNRTKQQQSSQMSPALQQFYQNQNNKDLINAHNKRVRNPTQSSSSETDVPPQKKTVSPTQPENAPTPVENKQIAIENDLSTMKDLMQDIASTVRSLNSRQTSPEPYDPVIPEDNVAGYHHNDNIEDPNKEFDEMHY